MILTRLEFLKLSGLVLAGVFSKGCGFPTSTARPPVPTPTPTPRFQVYSLCLPKDSLELIPTIEGEYGKQSDKITATLASGAEVKGLIFGEDNVEINPVSFAQVLNLAEQLRLNQHVRRPRVFETEPGYNAERFVMNRKSIADGSVFAFVPSDPTQCSTGNLAWTARPEKNSGFDQSLTIINLGAIEQYAGMKDIVVLVSVFGVEALQATRYREILTAVDESVAHGFGTAIAFVDAWKGGISGFNFSNAEEAYANYFIYCQGAYIQHGDFGEIPFAPITYEFFSGISEGLTQPVFYSWE